MMVTCSACGLISDCLMVVAGCVKMHVTDQYLCDGCVQNRRLLCTQCGDSIWDFAVHVATEDEPNPEWYTSWEGYYICPK
jgi:hypothetical protein